VDPKQLQTMAADLNYRLRLYEEMEKMGKQNLFPTKYANQQSFAEAELYEIAVEEFGSSQIRFIGTKTSDFMGKKQKFYLFVVSMEGEDETQSYLGIAGPFDPAGKKLDTYGKVTNFYWTEEYNKTKVDAHFKTFLKEAEESLKASD
jgi:hypothetical protein